MIFISPWQSWGWIKTYGITWITFHRIPCSICFGQCTPNFLMNSTRIVVPPSRERTSRNSPRKPEQEHHLFIGKLPATWETKPMSGTLVPGKGWKRYSRSLVICMLALLYSKDLFEPLDLLYGHTESFPFCCPNSVSTLRGSYGKCQRPRLGQGAQSGLRLLHRKFSL